MRRALPLALTVTVFATSSALAVAAPASAATAVSDCSKVLVIGARGSGDHNDATEPQYGPTVRQAIDGFASIYGSGNIETKYVDYPSESTDLLFGKGRNGGFDVRGLPRYLGGMDQGIATLKQMLKDEREACVDRRVALFGYSQGAAVVSRALMELGKEQHPAASNAKAIGLIADPTRVGSATYNTGGASAKDNGIAITAGRWPGLVFGPGHGAVAESLCTAGDIICAFRRGDAIAEGRSGFTKHTAYKTSGGLAYQLGRRMAAKVAPPAGSFTGTWTLDRNAGPAGYISGMHLPGCPVALVLRFDGDTDPYPHTIPLGWTSIGGVKVPDNASLGEHYWSLDCGSTRWVRKVTVTAPQPRLQAQQLSATQIRITGDSCGAYADPQYLRVSWWTVNGVVVGTTLYDSGDWMQNPLPADGSFPPLTLQIPESVEPGTLTGVSADCFSHSGSPAWVTTHVPYATHLFRLG